MAIVRYELIGTGALVHQPLAFNARFVKLRHIRGALDVEIAFNNIVATHLMLSPAAGTYAQDVTMEFEGGLSAIGVDAAVTETVEVIAWQ